MTVRAKSRGSHTSLSVEGPVGALGTEIPQEVSSNRASFAPTNQSEVVGAVPPLLKYKTMSAVLLIDGPRSRARNRALRDPNAVLIRSITKHSGIRHNAAISRQLHLGTPCGRDDHVGSQQEYCRVPRHGYPRPVIRRAAAPIRPDTCVTFIGKRLAMRPLQGAPHRPRYLANLHEQSSAGSREGLIFNLVQYAAKQRTVRSQR